MPASAGAGPGRRPGRDQPGQDQRHQRLLRVAGLDQLVHPDHQALPRPAGLPGLQPADRAGADGGEHVRLPQHHPRLLRQLRHGLGRRRWPPTSCSTSTCSSCRPSSPSSGGGCSTRSTRSASARCSSPAGVSILASSAGSAARSAAVTRRWSPSGSRWCCRRSSRSRPRAATTSRRTDDGIDLPMYDELRQPVGRRCSTCHVCGQRLRASGHGRLPDPRRVRLLAVPEHRQASRTTCCRSSRRPSAAEVSRTRAARKRPASPGSRPRGRGRAPAAPTGRCGSAGSSRGRARAGWSGRTAIGGSG